jgi:protein gp37
MGETSKIQWTDSTVNFWWGCTKVGPGCDHCYAESFDRRAGGAHWGVGLPRKKIRGAVMLIRRLNAGFQRWGIDLAEGRLHPSAGPRRRVFIQSMADLFDNEVPLDWFEEAWREIARADHLDIQIVTKRVSVIEKRLAAIGKTWPKHAGLLATVCNQTEADRDVPRLLALKDELSIPWVGLSIEPMLGPIVLHKIDDADLRLGWVICGGESGPCARQMNLEWALDLMVQCYAASLPFFMKQMHVGGKLVKDLELFPEDLRVRQFPEVKALPRNGAARATLSAIRRN